MAWMINSIHGRPWMPYAQLLTVSTSVPILCCGAWWHSQPQLLAPNKGHPGSKVHVTHMGPTRVLSAPGEPHVGPMNLALRAVSILPRLCEPGQTKMQCTSRCQLDAVFLEEHDAMPGDGVKLSEECTLGTPRAREQGLPNELIAQLRVQIIEYRHHVCWDYYLK